jgi:hypothetical protein
MRGSRKNALYRSAPSQYLTLPVVRKPVRFSSWTASVERRRHSPEHDKQVFGAVIEESIHPDLRTLSFVPMKRGGCTPDGTGAVVPLLTG